MSDRLSLIFGFHAHIPVGAPDDEVSRMVDGCYRPILDQLSRHPQFKSCAHFSGSALTRIEALRPEFISLLKTFVDRGQIEILGGGMYEPFLPALSETDRLGQIRRFGDYLQRILAVRPKGVWIAGQIWEPHLCRPLQDAAVQYVILEEDYVTAAGVPADRIFGSFLTEDGGHRMLIFPMNKTLGAKVAGHPPEEIISYLKKIAESKNQATPILVTVMSDGEKLLMESSTQKTPDPATRLGRLIDALERSEFVSTITPSEWSAAHPPQQLVYVPVRPAWKSFLMNYPESNWMQKRVFAASSRMGPVLEKLGSDRESRTIRDLLDKSTCNDAYWHGASGGIYLPALRRAVYQNLLEAENRFSKKMGLYPACFTDDFDADGHPELLVYAAQWVIGFKPNLGAGLFEWSYRPALYNFQNTMTRRSEDYHSNLGQRWRILTADKTVWNGPAAGLKEFLMYDRYPKCSGLLYALEPSVTFQNFKTQTLPEIVPALEPYEWKNKETPETFEIRFQRKTDRINFQKSIVISKQDSILSLNVSLEHAGAEFQLLMGVGLELFFGSLDCLTIRPLSLDEKQGAPDPVKEGEWRGQGIEFLDSSSGAHLIVKADREVRWFLTPSYTVSKIESGIDKLFQGMSIMMLNPAPATAGRQEMNFTLEAKSIAGTSA